MLGKDEEENVDASRLGDRKRMPDAVNGGFYGAAASLQWHWSDMCEGRRRSAPPAVGAHCFERQPSLRPGGLGLVYNDGNNERPYLFIYFIREVGETNVTRAVTGEPKSSLTHKCCTLACRHCKGGWESTFGGNKQETISRLIHFWKYRKLISKYNESGF